ncbi:hypothetical protein PG988_011618 [Apiospora saccharicola]
MAAHKQQPLPRRSSRILDPTITTYNFRAQKPQVSLPAVKRQSMRIAIANSLETNKLHNGAISSTDPGNALTKPSLDTTGLSSSSPARRPMRSAKQAALAAMAPPSRDGMLIATGQRRGSAASTGLNTTTDSKKARRQVKPKSKNQPQVEVEFPHGIPAERQGYYRIKGILTEVTRGGKSQYLVEWEGIDPCTGMAWSAEWVDEADLSNAALESWKAKNTNGKGGRVSH